LLRFLPQGDVPPGTFTEHHNAVGYAYAHWPLFTHYLSWHLGPVSIGWTGLLSVPPATATILLGSAAGDLLRNPSLDPRTKSRRLLHAGALCAAIGLAWAFDLPFNKPRWTPCYLLWVAGVDLVLMSLLSQLLDRRSDRPPFFTYPLVVFGSNAIAVYFLSILTKVLILNTPRLTYAGSRTSLGNALILQLQSLTTPHVGGWIFTIAFVTFWWLVLDQMYRRRWIWKV
jgi:predicted acyltransferase